MKRSDEDPVPHAVDAAQPPVTPNPWTGLRRFTPARIALGRAGAGLPTAAHLSFALAHAQARDAVHTALDANALARDLEAALPGSGPAWRLHSAAADRATYLQRPDLGRRLADASRELLAAARAPAGATSAPPDLALVVADGLSALAAQRHAAPLAAALRAELAADPRGWTWAAPAVVLQGRVAVGDEVGALLGASLVVVLIGERPGLSSPDSLGVYFTWQPRAGRTDAERNCISNVRPEGLPVEAAASKLAALLREARARGLSGVGLKDDEPPAAIEAAATPLFLLR